MARIECPNCHHHFENALYDSESSQRKQELADKAKTILFERDPLGQSISFTRRFYRQNIATFLSVFTFLWLGGSLIGLVIALYTVKTIEAFIFALFIPGLHVVTGFVLLYLTLMQYFNRSEVRITPKSMSVLIGPMPWFGSKTLPLAGVKNFSVEKYVAYRQNDAPVFSYRLVAIISDSSRVTLVKGFQRLDEALLVESEVEKFLRMPDDPQYDSAS